MVTGIDPIPIEYTMLQQVPKNLLSSLGKIRILPPYFYILYRFVVLTLSIQKLPIYQRY